MVGGLVDVDVLRIEHRNLEVSSGNETVGACKTGDKMDTEGLNCALVERISLSRGQPTVEKSNNR